MPEKNQDVVGMCLCFGIVLGLMVWLKAWGFAAGYALFMLLLELEDIRMTIARK